LFFFNIKHGSRAMQPLRKLTLTRSAVAVH
jgi:hypothetical protein